MVLEIVQFGDPVLRVPGRLIPEVTPEINELGRHMIETMRAANGVGLAAQQVGVPLQLAVIDVADVEDRPSAMWIDGKEVKLEDWMPMVLLNPKLELGKDREVGIEGCLSFPDITADISRAAHVAATAQLLDGRMVTFEAEGLLARALQHEVDHLNGVLFLDRMNSATKAGLSGRLKRLQKKNNVVSRPTPREKV
jgi:peptide deformylase